MRRDSRVLVTSPLARAVRAPDMNMGHANKAANRFFEMALLGCGPSPSSMT